MLTAATTWPSRSIGPAVLAAALALTTSVPSAGQNTALDLAAVKRLYESNRIDDAVALLRNHLQQQPDDARSRMLLGMFLARQGDLENAQAELGRVSSGNADVQQQLTRVKELVTARNELAAAGGELRDALVNYRIADARALTANPHLSPDAREVLGVYLDQYSGDFAAGMQRTNGIADRTVRDALRAQIQRAESDYRRYTVWVEHIVDRVDRSWDEVEWEPEYRQIAKEYHDAIRAARRRSPDASVLDIMLARDQKKEELVAKKFVEAMYGLNSSAPFSERAMATTFVAALLLRPYEEVQAIGDAILREKGSFAMPLERRRLVIDSAQRALTLQPNQTDVLKVLAKDLKDYEARYPPFVIGFDEVTEVSQVLELRDAGFPDVGKFELLVLKPGGRVPGPASNVFWSFKEAYGVEVQAEAVEKFGRFVHHVLGRPTVKLVPFKMKQKRSSYEVARAFNRAALEAGAALNPNASNRTAVGIARERDQRAQAYRDQANARKRSSTLVSEQFFDAAADAVIAPSFSDLNQLIAQMF